MICWTLGITEHHNAVDNVLALISLVLLTGHVGRYGSGVNPLRGQNNVQGGGDMGALPDRLPGFQHVENDELRARFDAEWGVPVPPKRGWHLSGMFDAMERGDLTAVYCIGENPVQSEADQKRAIALLRGPRLPRRPGPVPDEDRGPRRRRPAGDRGLGRERGHGHQLRASRPARPQGAWHPPDGARDDLAIIFELANRMGAAWGEPDPETVWDEVRRLSPVHAGMSYERLEELGGLQWPCYDEDHPGELFLHSRLWEDPVPGNRVPFVPVDHDPPVDRLDADFPIRLTTGRRLDSYNTGVQTAGYTSPLRRGESLDISPGGRGALRPGRRRDRPRRLAARPGGGPDPHRRVAATRPDLHDDALPGRGRRQPPDDRRDGPEVRHGRVQGHGHPHREARGAGPGLTRAGRAQPFGARTHRVRGRIHPHRVTRR